MVYGKPIGIPTFRSLAASDHLPQVADDHYIATGQCQPKDTPSLNSLFVHTASLYRVMDNIFARLRDAFNTVNTDLACRSHLDPEAATVSQSCCCNAESQLSMVLHLDGLLLHWHDTLPEYLQLFRQDQGINTRFPNAALEQRQRAALKIRFLGMRILLHRQTILFLGQSQDTRHPPYDARPKWPPQFSDNSGDPAVNHRGSLERPHPHTVLGTQLAHLSATLCVDSALASIEAIDHYRAIRSTGAWWWDFHCEYNHFPVCRSE